MSTPDPPRHNWDAWFRAMSEAGDDRLLDGEVLLLTEWEETEWEWTFSNSPQELNK